MTRRKTKKKSANLLDWQDLSAQPTLTKSFQSLAQEIEKAHNLAVQQAVRTGTTVTEHLDLSHAAHILQDNPQLLPFVRDIAEQANSLSGFIQKQSPTGPISSQGQAAAGVWSGNKAVTDGVPNARILRDWADSNEWVRAAINIRRQQIGRANIAVVPFNERKAYNKTLAKQIQRILDQPNELRQNYSELMSSMMDDLLVLDRGVLLKDMTVDRKPLHIYNEDGSCVKIYTQWDGNPKSPRYLYESPDSRIKIPLRNDEAIVIMSNPATYRYSLSPVQVLRNTIQADLEATKSATQMVSNKPPPHLVQLQGATQTQLEALRAKYDTEIAGRREVFFIGGPQPAKVQPLVFSAKDNQWLEWQIYLARKIAVVFQISPQQLGILYDINKATASSQQEIFEDTGLIPLLLLIEEYFNRELLADFAPTFPDGRSNFDALNLRIVYPEITESDRQMHAENAIKIAETALAGLPSMTLNMVLSMMGEEPVAGGNTFYAPTSNGPLAWLSYDGSTGDYGTASTAGRMGSQDPAGGPDEEESTPHSVNDDGGYAGPQNPIADAMVENGEQKAASHKRSVQKNYRVAGRRWIPNHPGVIDGD
jgi:phage portal protein BeeE